MITVTNPRVAGFSPRWRSFRGFTLLFNNPGNSLADWQGFQRVACNLPHDPALDFYRALRDGLEEIGIDMLTESYLFCALAPASYHVTAWDCINDDHATQVHAPYRPELGQALEGLPATLRQPNAFTALPLESELLTKRDWHIRFRFDGLFKWANIGIVARLGPADSEAAAYLQQFTAARDRLNTRFRTTFGVGASNVYVPHVTLGYFANKQLAQLSTPCIDGWSATVAARVGDLTLAFEHISLYGFTDLETFFRNPMATP
jgi:hypothetical protein